MAILERILDFFFLPRIPPAEMTLAALAPRAILEERASLRARGIRHLDRLTAAQDYRSSLLTKEAIAAFKYRRDTTIGATLAMMIASVACVYARDAVLCPVPLHWSRRLSRGFNQSELLADVVSRACDLPVRRLLRRMRPTGNQALRFRAERLRALRGSFAVTCENIHHHVILIDDLSTTGATLDACAGALKAAGAIFVEAWVVAKA